ncbi:MAG: hypothetical protein ACO1PI_08065 [Bacteroidota bacterium]
MATINKYPVFENNQVLTADQLNAVRAYLDEQTRITRTYLIGTGIVCGLAVTMQKAQNRIHISKGTGVTSEGFLISLGDCNLEYFRDFALPEGTSYPHFVKTGNQLYPMYELLTSTYSAEPLVKPLNQFPDANWQNYVVVLYLEEYDKDLKSCLGKSCDEIGIERIFTVRKLLVSKSDVTAINNTANPNIAPNKQEPIFLKQFDLKRLHMLRAMLNGQNAGDAGEVIWQYLSVSMMVVKSIMEACYEAYDAFQLLLQKSIPANPFTEHDLANWETKYQELIEKYLHGKLGVQYFYDFLHDITLAYNEFCCAASHLNNQCIPNEKAFPMHLMLGEISCPLSPLRQHFVSAPIINEQKEQNEKVSTLYKRIIAMLYSFDADLENLTKEKDILVTPSKEKNTRLGVRAIPVYYSPKNETPYGFSLADVWDEELCLPCRQLPAHITSYHTQIPIKAQEFPQSPSETPLFYNINDYPFLRIEGHIGQHESEARFTLGKIARTFNLDFKTITLFVGLGGKIEGVRCVFSDLETDYAIWRNKMRFVLTNLLKGIKTVENISGIGKAVKKESDYFDKQKKEEELKKETANPQASAAAPDGIYYKADYNTKVETEAKPSSNTKWADYAKRAIEFKVEKGDEQPTSDEEELSKRISDIRKCIKELIAAMPGDLEEFDFERWCDAYRCALNKWVDLMKQLAGKINDENSSESTRNAYRAIIVGMHFADEFLNFVLIYPYLTIATINDTMERRMEALKKEFNLSNTLKLNPGLEHTAGVYRGQTFVLVAFAESFKELKRNDFKDEASGQKKTGKGEADWQGIIKGEPDSFILKAIETYKELQDKGYYDELSSDMAGQVFADLTGTVCHCDPCKDIDVDNYNVTPIAFPVTRIIIEKDSEFPELRIQLLNNVYNPDEYEPFSSQGEFGSVTFEEEEYLPEDNKYTKILVYTPNAKKIKAAKKLVVIDTLNYAFVNKNTGDTASESTITIFIGVEEKKEIKYGAVRGTIDIISKGVTRIPSATELTFRVDGVIAPIDGINTQLYRQFYTMKLAAGTRTIEVSVAGMGSQSKTLEISSDEGVIAEANFVFEK